MAGSVRRRAASSSPIQQLIGQVNSQDSQYQCGQPLLQFGMMAAAPITSPSRKKHSTCRAGRAGAKRAQTQAQRTETRTNRAVLAMRALSDGILPFSKSPGNRRESSGSVV